MLRHKKCDINAALLEECCSNKKTQNKETVD